MPDKKEFLYRLQAIRAEMVSIGPTEKESRALEEHFAYLKDLTERGVVLLAGRTLQLPGPPARSPQRCGTTRRGATPSGAAPRDSGASVDSC